jgi:hypothetical protein
MTCEPIEIICEDCGRLRTSVLVDAPHMTPFDKRRLRLEAFILAMHREAQHGEK